MDGKITSLSAIGTIDRTADVIEIVDVSANGGLGTSFKVTVNNLLGLTSNPVGLTDSQTLTNKTLTAPTITSPVINGTISGTYTLGGTVTFPSTVVTLTGTQTLTNKTLTSPTINTPTIVNASISADAVVGFSSANNGSIYGFAISGGVPAAGSVPAAALVNSSINASKVSWSATGAGAGIWWEELGRTTLVSSGTAMTITSFTARKYLKIITNHIQVGVVAERLRFNNDSGGNYSRRSGVNQAADTTTTSDTSWDMYSDTGQYRHLEMEITNTLTSPKLGIYSFIVTGNGSSPATAPNRVEGIGIWGNIVSQITRVDYLAITGSFAAGSEIIVLGHD